jgi:nucleoside-diphosphate kinase
MPIERTFVTIKPDGVQRGLTGEIIRRFDRAGLKIVAMRMLWIDKEFAKRHYKAHVDKKFYPGLEAMITEGPVVAIVLEGVNAIENVRRIVGPTEPKSAPPGTIRGDFAHISYEHADKENKAVKNVIHASGNKEDAEYEINLWFHPEEIHSYKRVDENHVM